jgi:hypothetical protein
VDEDGPTSAHDEDYDPAHRPNADDDGYDPTFLYDWGRHRTLAEKVLNLVPVGDRQDWVDASWLELDENSLMDEKAATTQT